MSVRVRLTRVGSKKNAIWRVVVADQRSPRDGRSIENLGYYNPQTQPSTIVIDRERLDYWLERGAQPTGTVKKLLRAPNTEVAVAAPPAPVEEATANAAEAEADAPADVAAAAEPQVEETPAEPEAAAEETASEPDPEAPAEDAPAEAEPEAAETAEAGSEPDPEAPSTESA
jgi:small subunit ribosomal protein S16